MCISDEEKALMLKIAKERISFTYNKYKDICTLSEIRERQDIKQFDDIFYGNNAIEYVKHNWKKEIAINYAFWGATETSRKLNSYIFENYPNAHLLKVFDWSVRDEIEYEEGKFIPIGLDNIPINNELFIFVTGNSASEAALELFRKINKPVNTYFLCQRQVLEEDDFENV